MGFTLYRNLSFLILLCINAVWGKDIEINNKLTLRNAQSGWDLIYKTDSEERALGIIGHGFNDQEHQVLDENNLRIKILDVILSIRLEHDDHNEYVHITWTGPQHKKLQDCYTLGMYFHGCPVDAENAQWYGGPQQKRQFWPIQKLKLVDYSYISKEADNAAIMEPYWLSSQGMFIYVHKTTPLFVDQNNTMKDSVCFIAEVQPPYSKTRSANSLSYTLGFARDARAAHMAAVQKYLGKPSDYPDYRMTEYPIWSTWAEYKRPINESVILDFAQKILDSGFNNSQLEIDDLWEVCYGSLTVDTEKFPDLKALNIKLKQMGFRVTVWIHPFINQDCNPWYTEALNNGYLVKSERGEVSTSWWNSDGPTAAYIDFTNPKAAKWWSDRLEALRTKYEIDSYKFDAGESSWSPQVPVQIGNVYEHPSHITRRYVEECAKFGSMVEVRAGQRTQNLPVLVRMIDKDSEWNFENGLPTLVTTLLQMNMNGYPLVLPDMIGGNGYNGSPSKEMFIRWLQANTFMPVLQYSYVPWDYDEETIRISYKFTALHAKYTFLIIKAYENAVRFGIPVNPPIWWEDPNDLEAQKIWDEYMLGSDVLVAPILDQGKTSRDVYLPKGNWMDKDNEDKIYTGPIWLRNYAAPLDTLPYFIKIYK